MQLAHQYQHQTHTAPVTLPRLSPFQAAIRAHRIAAARVDDAYARRDAEGPRFAALDEAEGRAWRTIMATPCTSSADAAALLTHTLPAVHAELRPNLVGKLAEALQVVLEEHAAPPGDGGPTSPISLAIRAHQLAYEARQAASVYLDATGQQARKSLSWAAEEAENDAVSALLETPCSDLRGAGALVAHIEWYLSAAERPSLMAALKARAADIRLFLVVGLSGADREIDALNLDKALEACREAWGRLQATTAETGDVRWDAEGEAREAAYAVQEAPCGSRADAEALRAHLRWFVPELERADLDGAQGFLEGLRARLADLEMLLASDGGGGAGLVPALVS